MKTPDPVFHDEFEPSVYKVIKVEKQDKNQKIIKKKDQLDKFIWQAWFCILYNLINAERRNKAPSETQIPHDCLKTNFLNFPNKIVQKTNFQTLKNNCSLNTSETASHAHSATATLEKGKGEPNCTTNSCPGNAQKNVPAVQQKIPK